jgi:hypothetical protein
MGWNDLEMRVNQPPASSIFAEPQDLYIKPGSYPGGCGVERELIGGISRAGQDGFESLGVELRRLSLGGVFHAINEATQSAPCTSPPTPRELHRRLALLRPKAETVLGKGSKVNATAISLHESGRYGSEMKDFLFRQRVTASIDESQVHGRRSRRFLLA